MTRQFVVYGPTGSQQYNAIDKHPSGSRFTLTIGEATFYACGDLHLAVCEAARYGAEQFGWPPRVTVEITDPLEIYGLR